MMPERDLPEAWPAAPVWELLTLENPWPLAATLALIAAGMFVVGGRRGQRRVQLAAALVALLAGGAIGLAAAVQTGREAMRENTRALVAAAVHPFSEAPLAAMIRPGAQLVIGEEAAVWKEVLAVAGDRLRRTPLRAAQITRLDAAQDSAAAGRTHVVVLARLDSGGAEGWIKSRWVFTWKLDPDSRWRVSRAQLLSIYDEPLRRPPGG